MKNSFLVGFAAWLVPGLGHLMLGRWTRGLILGLVIWVMFVIAILSGGAYYPGFNYADGALLYLLNIFARFGNGFGALISYWIASEPAPGVAARATFEYGGRFLEVAGLLNYLAVLDTVDILKGRKE